MGVSTNIMAADSRPQLIMIRAIQRLAPYLCKAILLGISNIR